MMIVVRPWLLLWLVPAVARADVTAPSPPAARAAAAPTTLEYTGPAEGAPPPRQWVYTEYPPGARLFVAADGRPVRVARPAEPAEVGGRHDRWYVVDDAGRRARRFGGELTPLRFVVDGRVVTVFLGADYRVHVHAPPAPDLVLRPAGEAYLGVRGGKVSAAVVAGAAPGVELLRVASRPEACANYWEDYVSVAGGAPHVALALDGVADPPAFATPTVEFDVRAGRAVVTTRIAEEENGPTRATRRRYRWNGTTFVASPGSKRAPRLSK